MNLPRTFIAGAVSDSGTGDYIKVATVSLEELATGKKTDASTDIFGDFEFDGLPANRIYKLTVAREGYYAKTLIVYLGKDRYLSEIRLTKRL